MRRKDHEAGARRLDQVADAAALVAGQFTYDYNIAAPEI